MYREIFNAKILIHYAILTILLSNVQLLERITKDNS